MKTVLFLAFFLLSACTTLPASNEGEKTEVITQHDFAWKNPAWSKALIDSVYSTNLLGAQIKDAGAFCPRYEHLTDDQMEIFWGTFLVAIAKRESNYKPALTYTESFNDAQGRPVISTGLFQISQESASASAYGCGRQTTEGLKDPIANIKCSVRIIARWVLKDGFAAGREGANVGCGRYFSTCRSATASRAYIASQTSALKFCH